MLVVLLGATGPTISCAQSLSVKGQVLDADSHLPIEYASVELLNRDSLLVKGTVTDIKGKFILGKLDANDPIIKIHFIGYETISLSPGFKNKHGEITIPDIYLSAKKDLLTGLSIKGQRNTTNIQLDKQVVDAKKFQTATNGTGLDLLQKMPSITVTNEGEIALRGSTGFIVLLNGKPSNRTPVDILAQLPANTIDNVEIITSPSAKYDAEGKAGIINIITKKDINQGWSISGNSMFGGFSPLRFGGDLQLNYNAKRWSFYVAGDYRRYDFDGHRAGIVRSVVGDTLTYLPSDGIRNYRDHQYSFRTGGSYVINAANIFTVAFYHGFKESDRLADLHYQQYSKFPAGSNLYDGSFSSAPQLIFNHNLFVRSGKFITANFDYSHIFHDKSKLTFLGVYEYSVLGGPLSNTEEIEGTNTLYLAERSTERSPLHGIRLQADYAVQLNKDLKLETGYQWRQLNEKGYFSYERKDANTNGSWFKEPACGDNLSLRQHVQAGYVQLAGQKNKFNYNAGLRAEAMNRVLTDELNVAPFKYTAFNFFPSAQGLWNLAKKQKIRLGYSRRIDWPTAKFLSPFKNKRHLESIEIGDPNLRPEIADVLEFSYAKSWKKVNLTSTLFYNNVKDKVFRVNEIYSPTILLRTYTNAGNATSIGGEFSADITITNWWKLYASASVYNFTVNGNFKGKTTNNSSFNYNGNANTSIDITKQLKFQWDITYVSASVTSQGKDGHYMLSNAGLKYAGILKNKATIALQLNNIFNTNIQTIQTAQTNFYSTTDYTKYDRVLQLSIGFRINENTKKVKVVKTEYGEKEF
jgi:outer membrane receptor protein involved in Fe transport